LSASEQPAASPAIQDQLPAEDHRLLEAIQRKDRKATAEFVSRYADAVYRYVFARLVPRADQVDDLVQEIFLAAWENLSQYRGTSSLGSWLMGIARHKVADYYRACLREPEPLEPNEGEPRLGTRGPDLDDFISSELLRRKTWQTLRSLPEKHRIVLLWRYWEKCSAREMAARTGKTEKAIERLLARAREEFRRMWSDE
jgi:RNA polymerase sigma-70 factor (ECF subfamily)